MVFVPDGCEGFHSDFYFCVAVAVDFEDAYNRVSVNVLIIHLLEINISSLLLNWTSATFF